MVIHVFLDKPIEEHAPSKQEEVAFLETEHFVHEWPQWGEPESESNNPLAIVSLLVSCAESVSSGNHRAVAYFLSRLGDLASPRGSPVHRLAAYFAEALALRAAKLWPGVFALCGAPREFADTVIVDDDGDGTALRLLNQVSPIPKFVHFTLNERLLRAFEGKERVHIVDFDIKDGLQWPSLLQSLAARPNPPAHVRITGIGSSKQELQDTGFRLKGFSERLNLKFEFHPVVDRLEDVRLWMLHVKDNECVAVNCVLQLHKVLYDEALADLLGLIRSANPSILLVAEEEAEHNDARWETRFAKALTYYAAMFDSLRASLLPEDSLARIMIEEMLARRIRNVVGCEGRERVERHESFERWREMLRGGGFANVGLGEAETMQSRMLLRLYSSGEDYGVESRGECGDGLTLKFLDQPLYTVSAWAPTSFAGGSSASRRG